MFSREAGDNLIVVSSLLSYFRELKTCPFQGFYCSIILEPLYSVFQSCWLLVLLIWHPFDIEQFETPVAFGAFSFSLVSDLVPSFSCKTRLFTIGLSVNSSILIGELINSYYVWTLYTKLLLIMLMLQLNTICLSCSC